MKGPSLNDCTVWCGDMMCERNSFDSVFMTVGCWKCKHSLCTDVPVQ